MQFFDNSSALIKSSRGIGPDDATATWQGFAEVLTPALWGR